MARRERRLVLVGLGRSAEVYRDALADVPEVTLWCAVDPDPARRLRAAETGLPAFEGVAEMLQCRNVPDLALIASPTGTHPDVARPLLRAGVDCLVEGPLAATPDDADGLAALAERLGRTCSTTQRYRLWPALATARALVAAGRIGALERIEISLCRKADARGGWRADPALSGGGVWMEEGPAALEIAESLLGPLDRLRLVRAEQEQGGEIEDEVAGELHHICGVLCQVRLSWNGLQPEPVARCVGSRGEIRIGALQMVVESKLGRELVRAPYERRSAAVGSLRRFLRECLWPEPPVDGGAECVAWLHAGYRSLRASRWERA